MCTVVIDRRPGDAWPLLLGANRDEMAGRPWLPPARHWPSRPEVVAGMDELAGGSWLGINDWGVVACILNRQGTLGPLPGVRSRGELVLDALDVADAKDAADFLVDVDPLAYRPFNMIVADNRDAFWIRHADRDGADAITVNALPVGLSVLTALELDDPEDPRIRAFLPRFRAVPRPDPDLGPEGWREWTTLLASRTHDVDKGPSSAMCFQTARGFGTVSSALVALPSMERTEIRPLFHFAKGPPDRFSYEPIAL
ncbi:MAG: NRDE family protein [Rhodospirillum sp.]|nr:NRDE family protein [Rhodospirillum sp.]MCF8490640.1 NRDE family protein [Rhodospirillum sp.]MCF8500730.1 NRDE family protein [Rhodospirillum sp.]